MFCFSLLLQGFSGSTGAAGLPFGEAGSTLGGLGTPIGTAGMASSLFETGIPQLGTAGQDRFNPSFLSSGSTPGNTDFSQLMPMILPLLSSLTQLFMGALGGQQTLPQTGNGYPQTGGYPTGGYEYPTPV